MISLSSLPLKPHQIVLTLVVIIISIIAFTVNTTIFHYQRDLFESGDLWRGISSHFLHTNFNHLILNLVAVVLLWALHGQFYTFANYTVVFIFSAIMATLGIHFFSPEINQYVGLSGVLHGFFIWGAFKDIEHKDKTGYLLLLGVLGKVIYEQIVGPNQEVASLINATVAIDAHLWGMIGGAFVGVFSLILTKKTAI